MTRRETDRDRRPGEQVDSKSRNATVRWSDWFAGASTGYDCSFHVGQSSTTNVLKRPSNGQPSFVATTFVAAPSETTRWSVSSGIGISVNPNAPYKVRRFASMLGCRRRKSASEQTCAFFISSTLPPPENFRQSRQLGRAIIILIPSESESAITPAWPSESMYNKRPEKSFDAGKRQKRPPQASLPTTCKGSLDAKVNQSGAASSSAANSHHSQNKSAIGEGWWIQSRILGPTSNLAGER